MQWRLIFAIVIARSRLRFKKVPSKHSSWWRRLWSSSSEDVFKASWSRRIYSPYSYVFRRLLQAVFKTSLSRPTYSSWSYVFKTSTRHLQDVFKTYYQVKVFLATQFQDIFETYSKHFWGVLLRRLSTGGLPRSHFREIYGHCAKFPRVIKIPQVLIFHFTTPFSGCTLQRRI